MCRTLAVPAAALLLLPAACTGPPPSPSAPPPAAPPATSPGPSAPSPVPAPATSAPRSGITPAAGPAVLVGAGDIASCDSRNDSRTAALVAATPGTVFTLGDNAYPDGTPGQFARCYGPAWGRFRDRTRPVIGNHEYHTRGAAGHFGYFGAAAGPRGKGYYSYDAGSWHVVVLNTNCETVAGGCGAGSPQHRWLRADLAASGAHCTVAMAHHPLFTSAATHDPATATRPLVRVLHAAGVELLLTGHNHVYERFAPQDADGRRDTRGGIRAFVVGTGGAGLYPFGRAARNSEVRHNKAFGVLRLTLPAGAYRWEFLAVPGSAFRDAGSGTCH